MAKSPGDSVGWVRIVSAIFAVALLVTGCADADSGHRFATDPRPTATAAQPTVVVTRPPESIPPTAAPTRAAAQLLRPRGAPSRLYFGAGSVVVMVDLKDRAAEAIWTAKPSDELIGFAPSPSAAQVAVLVRDAANAKRADVYVLDADGSVAEAYPDIASRGQSLGPKAVATSIDWSPQGDQLVIGFDPGGVKTLSVRTGSSLPVADPSLTKPTGTSWSPTGQHVAMIADGANGKTLKVVTVSDCCDPGTPGPRAIRVEDLGQARAFAWMPDGRRLLIARPSPNGGGVAPIELWVVGLGTERSQHVLSAGSTVPAGSIDKFSLAADGRALAYTVTTLVEGEPTFDSLWITDIAGGLPFRVPLPVGSVVTDLWWTSQGLVVQVVDLAGLPPGPGTSSVPFSLLLVATPGTPESLLEGKMEWVVTATPTPVPTPTPLG